jgi:hypothetical protein
LILNNQSLILLTTIDSHLRVKTYGFEQDRIIKMNQKAVGHRLDAQLPRFMCDATMQQLASKVCNQANFFSLASSRQFPPFLHIPGNI